ncbi:hypothetical protein GCM10020331_101610 [Ectobacillus funiculus]
MSVKPEFISIRNVYNTIMIRPITVEIKMASHASLPADEAKPNITVVPICKKNTVIVKKVEKKQRSAPYSAHPSLLVTKVFDNVYYLYCVKNMEKEILLNV